MKKPLLWAFCLSSLGALASPAALVPYSMKADVLPNGLTVVRVAYPSPGIAAFYSVVRVGSRNEVEPGHTGFAHFFEHMMFRGTPAHPGGERAKILATKGFNENAFTTDDVTVYHVVGPSQELKTLVELEADRFQNLSYSEAAFQTEAKAVLGEYHKNAANPGLKIEETLNATAFTQHTYRHTTLGFYADILKMPERYEYSKTFFRRWYTPDNTLIFIAGDFDDAQVMNWVRSFYGPWQGKTAPVSIPVEPRSQGERKAKVEWKTQTLPRHLHAWKTPSSLKDAAIQNILAAYLVGPTSPAYKQLVLQQHAVQSLESEYSDHRDPGLFILSATLKDESKRADVKNNWDSEIQKLVSGKIDVQRLQDIKDHLRFGLLMSFETPSEVALQLCYFAGLYGTPDALEKLYRAMATVTPQELANFVREHFTFQNRTLIEFAPTTSETTEEHQ